MILLYVNVSEYNSFILLFILPEITEHDKRNKKKKLFMRYRMKRYK